MLTPQQILDIIETLYPQIDELNVWITSDLIRRVMARLGRGEGVFLTASDEWQLEVYQAAGGHLDAVQREIKRWTKATDAEIKRIFEDAGIKALAYDSNFYVEHGLAGIELAQSESMIRLLEDTYQRTAGTVHNFTRTTAHSSQQQLLKALDTAHFKVASGATSYTQAVQEAVSSIVDTQTQVIYPTGHVDTIETAVLRAVRTGVAQASGNMAVQGMEERDWDIVLVSAHLGARYGDGGQNPGNHFWWQGKFYSRTGRTPDLPLFAESTGYGTGEGLCGWNCRHSFGPGDLRHNPYAQFDAEENKIPFTATKSLYDPATELGDQVKIGELVHSVMFNVKLTLDHNFRADIEAPNSEELSEEYPYLSEVQHLKQTTEELNGAIQNAAKELAGKVDDTALAAEIERAQGVEVALSERIGNEETRAKGAEDGLSKRIKSIEDSSPGALAQRVSALETTVSGHTQSISALNTAISNHASDISQLAERVQNAEGDIDALQSTVGGHTTALSEVQGTVTDLQTRLTTAEGTIAAHDTAISTLQTKVSNIEAALVDIYNRLNALDSGGTGT